MQLTGRPFSFLLLFSHQTMPRNSLGYVFYHSARHCRPAGLDPQEAEHLVLSPQKIPPPCTHKMFLLLFSPSGLDSTGIFKARRSQSSNPFILFIYSAQHICPVLGVGVIIPDWGEIGSVSGTQILKSRLKIIGTKRVSLWGVKSPRGEKAGF